MRLRRRINVSKWTRFVYLLSMRLAKWKCRRRVIFFLSNMKSCDLISRFIEIATFVFLLTFDFSKYWNNVVEESFVLMNMSSENCENENRNRNDESFDENCMITRDRRTISFCRILKNSIFANVSDVINCDFEFVDEVFLTFLW